jgi:SnoaL-like domain
MIASSMIAASESSFDIAGIAVLLIRFSDAVDQRQPSTIAELFTADGLFQPGDKSVRGRTAIQDFYAARLADARRRTRHLWSNLLVQPMLPGRVRFKAVLTNYAFEPAVSESAWQMRLGNVTGACEQDDDGHWRFAEQLYERVLATSLPLTDPSVPKPRT